MSLAQKERLLQRELNFSKVTTLELFGDLLRNDLIKNLMICIIKAVVSLSKTVEP